MTFESDEELTAAEKQRVERVQRRQEEAVQKYEEEEERRMDERQVHIFPFHCIGLLGRFSL